MNEFKAFLDAVRPEVESTLDRLLPADVTGLRAEPLDGAVRLVWDSTPDTDAYGYRIYRRGDDGRWNDELGEVHRGMAAVEVPARMATFAPSRWASSRR